LVWPINALRLTISLACVVIYLTINCAQDRPKKMCTQRTRDKLEPPSRRTHSQPCLQAGHNIYISGMCLCVYISIPGMCLCLYISIYPTQQPGSFYSPRQCYLHFSRLEAYTLKLRNSLLIGLDRNPLVVLCDLEGLHCHSPLVGSQHCPELVACQTQHLRR
jgi:hypothetical protein